MKTIFAESEAYILQQWIKELQPLVRTGRATFEFFMVHGTFCPGKLLREKFMKGIKKGPEVGISDQVSPSGHCMLSHVLFNTLTIVESVRHFAWVHILEDEVKIKGTSTTF